MPCNRLDLGDFSRIQECIRSTTKCSPDIESDNEFSRRARISGVGCIHNEDRGRATGVEYFLGIRHTFLPITEIKASGAERPHIGVDLVDVTPPVRAAPRSLPRSAEGVMDVWDTIALARVTITRTRQPRGSRRYGIKPRTFPALLVHSRRRSRPATRPFGSKPLHHVR